MPDESERECSMHIFDLCKTKFLLRGLVCLLSLVQPATAAAILAQNTQQIPPRQEIKSSGDNPKPATPPAPTDAAQKEPDSKTQGTFRLWAKGLLEVLKIVVSWPFVIAALLFYLAFFGSAPSRLATVLKPFRSLKLFGTEFVLSEEAGTDAEQAIEVYRKQVKRKFDSLVEIHDIRSKLEAVIGEVNRIIERRMKITDSRCTLHVPDILFADTLYQLLDYYPLGGGRGRTFSSRFGIIGLCWRSKEDQIKGEVPTDPQELIRDWGMTTEQAAASGNGRQSFMALVLRDHIGTPVAIFYMDAKEKNAFGDDSGRDDFGDKLKRQAISSSNHKGLIASLEKLRDDLKDRRPLIRIHEQ
jgi:hypothetical protein